MTDEADIVRLNEYDREEWWEVAQIAKPDITREEFEADWEEFQRLKALRAQH